MSKIVRLQVRDKEIISTDITYNDLVILYNQYIETYGEVPLFSKCDSKHNMPQGRIINKVLKENNVTYNDFLLQFGKVSHVRTESKDYDLYVNKFKEISNKFGRGLKQSELINNQYGLPNAQWFIKNCPNKKVNTYDKFVLWCGFESNTLKNDDTEIGQKLIQLENRLGRHITYDDITVKNIGFSTIVVDRIYGSLTNAKKKLGLLKTPTNQPRPFEYYKNKLSNTLFKIKEMTGRDIVSWADIENNLYDPDPCEHKTYSKSFKNQNVDIFTYIKSLGFQMNPSNFSNRYTFDDGERVVSTLEFDFSTYIRSIGYVYNSNYKRDVLYRTFSDVSGKINCDYCMNINGINLYIEIAGIINKPLNGDWKTHKYSSKTEQNYQEKMIKKEKLLIDSGNNFLFLFKDDIINLSFKKLLNKEICKIMKEAA